MNKHVKCSLFIIREMQNETTMKYHYAPIKWLKLNTTPSVRENEKQTNCHKTLVGVKWSNYLEETFVTYPMIHSYPSKSMTMDFDPREMKMSTQTC